MTAENDRLNAYLEVTRLWGSSTAGEPCSCFLARKTNQERVGA